MKKLTTYIAGIALGLSAAQSAYADDCMLFLPDDRVIDTISAKPLGDGCRFILPDINEYYQSRYGGEMPWGGDTLYVESEGKSSELGSIMLGDSPIYQIEKVTVKNQCGATDSAYVRILFPTAKSVASVRFKAKSACLYDSLSLADIVSAEGYSQDNGFVSPSRFVYDVAKDGVSKGRADGLEGFRLDSLGSEGDYYVTAIDTLTGCYDSVAAFVSIDTLCYKPLEPSQYVFVCPQSGKATGYADAQERFTVKTLGEFVTLGAECSKELSLYAKGGRVNTFLEGDKCADSLVFIYSASIVDYDTTLQCQTTVYISRPPLSAVVPSSYSSAKAKPCIDVFPDLFSDLQDKYGKQGYSFKQYPPKGYAVEYPEQTMTLFVSDGCREQEFEIERIFFEMGYKPVVRVKDVCIGDERIAEVVDWSDKSRFFTVEDEDNNVVWSNSREEYGSKYFDTLAVFKNVGLYSVYSVDTTTLCRTLTDAFDAQDCSFMFVCPQLEKKEDYFSALSGVYALNEVSAFLKAGGKIHHDIYEDMISDSLNVVVNDPKVCDEAVYFTIEALLGNGKTASCKGSAPFERESSKFDLSVLADTVYPNYRGNCLMTVPDLLEGVMNTVVFSDNSIDGGADLKIAQYPRSNVMLETQEKKSYTEAVFVEVTDVCSGKVLEKKEVTLFVPSVESIVNVKMQDTTVCVDGKVNIADLAEVSGNIKFMRKGMPYTEPIAYRLEVSKGIAQVDTLDYMLDDVDKSGKYTVTVKEFFSECTATASAFIGVDTCYVPPIDTIPHDTIPGDTIPVIPPIDTIPSDTIPHDTIPAVVPTPELTVVIDSITYELDTLRGVYEVVGGCLSDVLIKEEIDSVPVVFIRYQAFMDCGNVRSVRLPDGLAAIGDSAFFGCVNLKEVVCSNELTERLGIVKGDWGNGYVAYYADSVSSPISVPTIYGDLRSGVMCVYSITGVKVMQTERMDDVMSLPKGVYVVVSAKGVEKVIRR